LAGLPAQVEAEYYVVMMADMGLKPEQKKGLNEQTNCHT
jgi:hypothetical protein